MIGQMKSTTKKQLEGYKYKETISGSKVCIYTRSDESFVLKTFSGSRICSEVILLNKMKNPGIIKVIKVFNDDISHSILMPYAYNGSLNSANASSMTVAEIGRIYYRILSSIDFIHSKGVMHGDIRPHNIVFLTHMGFLEPFLIDFEYSSCFGYYSDEFCRCMNCTPRYSAPEIIQKQKHTKLADIYSLGLSFSSFLKGKVVQPSSASFHSFMIQHYPPSLYDLLLKMTEKNPAFRLSCRKCISHPFFKYFEMDLRIRSFHQNEAREKASFVN